MLKTLESPADSADSELEEAALRIALAFAGMAFFCFTSADVPARSGLIACSAYLLWSVALGWFVRRSARRQAVRTSDPRESALHGSAMPASDSRAASLPEGLTSPASEIRVAGRRASVFRRSIALMVDQLSITAVLWLCGLSASPLLFAYLWVILGACMRYGGRWGAGTALCAAVGLVGLALSHAEWRGHHGFVLGWLVALAVAPAYITLLTTRLTLRLERYRIHSQQLAIAAMHDRMTGLPNREHFEWALETALRQLRTAGSGALAVLFVDLDGFKSCNDLYGHAAGDELLCMIARDLRSTVRASDLAARFGGDEFAILLNGLRSVEDAARIVAAIIRRTQELRTVAGHAVRISASAGISYIRSEDAHEIDNSAAVIARADRAMLRAKRSGKSTFRLGTGPQSVLQEFELLTGEHQTAA